MEGTEPMMSKRETGRSDDQVIEKYTVSFRSRLRTEAVMRTAKV